MKLLTRRSILRSAGAIGLGALCGPAFAQGAAGGSGLLAKLQAAKKVRVGIANQPPFSVLNPDGTLSGMGPAVAQVIMGRLGVPEMEGFIGTYGELIPGLLAGRWDFIAACLTNTTARCEQVQFADPLIFDGGAMVYLKSTKFTNPPTKIADLAGLNMPIGVQAGGAHMRTVSMSGVAEENLRQFTNDPALVDGLLAGRAAVITMSAAPMRRLVQQRNLDAVVVFPIPDLPAHGSGNAFRVGDTDLHAAYQKELRAMKKSGEFVEISRKNGFEPAPEVLTMTYEDSCKIP